MMDSREIEMTLGELARITGGRVDGAEETAIFGVCSLDHPRKGRIAMVTGGAKASWPDGKERPSALIVSKPPEGVSLPFLVHENPRLAFTLIIRAFQPESLCQCGIEPQALIYPGSAVDESAWVGPFAVVEPGARIESRAQISAGCYIGRDSVIGPETVLYPNVAVMHDVTIGARCVIHSGTVIGSDGFGFTTVDGRNLKVPQVGRVVIGDDVEIGANCAIDRATLDATIIGDDVKIDNLVQVAHNVKIGPHTRIAAQAGLSGRVTIGANVVIAGQAGFADGIKVGDRSTVAGRAAVIGDLPPDSKVSGYPARDHRKALRLLAAQNRLPEIIDRLEKLERMMLKKNTS
jgi:UDP-3-O-[3-hydroxymyristoyl] glucosamine N-acyltransferase